MRCLRAGIRDLETCHKKRYKNYILSIRNKMFESLLIIRPSTAILLFHTVLDTTINETKSIYF